MKTKHIPLVLCLLAASACGRVADVGKVPEMSAPHATPEFQAMAEPVLPVGQVRPDSGASLWAGQQLSLVGDRRAGARGDILTVVIEIDDKAEIQNSSGRSRSSSESVGIPQMIGIPQRLDEKLPEGASMAELASAKGASTFKGTGNISRRDKLTLRVAATVIDRLPNGVLHIQGSQEVRVNYEVRELTVSGFVRPTDISRDNEVAYDRIAGARISYGGHGQISDVQQPRYGQQLADIVLPY
ncbi:MULTISPECIES: flagellar basal body L-ring protein FlgH [unclassified Paracoccus (in: a-proteobacteria)]|uniref:flagellar basal body L-ring protein FlgH n=1 Tax=unclassified Paracoccus (in: a-proteobacteria) TaxID=2688777 RepID=UPI00160264CA|nr:MULTISPECIES: flagellar basal body L-ring protein FlgH [unclassified Paracoccus (in: a-proteobacteria)]MBB1490784.1 flagellar basal body L-ring protein FlgH [Paracoccus sp. MC1854]MBB1497373.1 flagellar basal body L-ring protein FlgH [Paracoccus sp. MC1862]QQO45866.1 flagellar basal body L-ring protein FlgH [Paracoccus sp. MC1862]